MGFPVPVGAWFRGRFRAVIDEFVLSERTARRDLFDSSFVRRLVVGHESGEDHSERLWALVNLEMWLRQFVDGEDIRSGVQAFGRSGGIHRDGQDAQAGCPGTRAAGETAGSVPGGRTGLKSRNPVHPGNPVHPVNSGAGPERLKP